MREETSRTIRTVTIVPNIDKPAVPKVARELVQWMANRGIRSIIKEEDAVKLDMRELAADEPEIQSSDIVICLGGDGTILRGVRLLNGAAVPVVGVNFGRVGFLSEVEYNEFYPAMELLVEGDFSIDERMMLKCTLAAGDFQHDYLALNEVSIERGKHMRLVEIDTYISGEFFSRYTSDGLIFATPTGSTAYSFSAGGPIVSPDKDLILMAPINPHSLFGRTLVLGSHEKIRIEPCKPLEVMVGVDGFAVFETVLDSLEIEKAEPKALLVKLKDRSFYTLFKEKLRVWDTWLR